MLKRKCATHGCPKKRKNKSKYCSCCAARHWATDHPIAYTLNKLRNNSKRRKIPCTLTLAQFTQFCAENPQYMLSKGRGNDFATIDRRKRELGYSIGNIRVLTLKDNLNWRFGREPPGYDLKNGNPFN